MAFTINIFLPYSKKTVSIKQFTNFQYKNLLKTLTNKNFQQCNAFINELISNCSFGDLTDINFIDKLVILLNLRCISVGDTLIQSFEQEKNKYNLKYNIYNIIDKIVNSQNIVFSNNISYKSLQIKTDIPKSVFINSRELHNFISFIKIGNKMYNFNCLSEKDKLDATNALPGSIITQLYENIYSFKQQLQNLDLLNLRTGIDNTDEIPIKLYLDQENMLTLISVFFNEHITNLFLKQFILSKEHNISCEYYDLLPPVESEIFYNFHKELQEHEKQQANSSKNPQIPVAPIPEM